MRHGPRAHEGEADRRAIRDLFRLEDRKPEFSNVVRCHPSVRLFHRQWLRKGAAGAPQNASVFTDDFDDIIAPIPPRKDSGFRLPLCIFEDKALCAHFSRSPCEDLRFHRLNPGIVRNDSADQSCRETENPVRFHCFVLLRRKARSSNYNSAKCRNALFELRRDQVVATWAVTFRNSGKQKSSGEYRVGRIGLRQKASAIPAEETKEASRFRLAAHEYGGDVVETAGLLGEINQMVGGLLRFRRRADGIGDLVVGYHARKAV